MYEAYEDPYNYYLVSEYCEGGELYDYLIERKMLSE
jgi:serine/threonine protein kinase